MNALQASRYHRSMAGHFRANWRPELRQLQLMSRFARSSARTCVAACWEARRMRSRARRELRFLMDTGALLDRALPLYEKTKLTVDYFYLEAYYKAKAAADWAEFKYNVREAARSVFTLLRILIVFMLHRVRVGYYVAKSKVTGE